MILQNQLHGVGTEKQNWPLRSIFLLLLLCYFLPGILHAQNQEKEVSGTIVNPFDPNFHCSGSLCPTEDNNNNGFRPYAVGPLLNFLYLWPRKTIEYEIDKSLVGYHRKNIPAAVKMWKAAGINFVLRSSVKPEDRQTRYISFYTKAQEDACFTHMGAPLFYGSRDIQLNSRCRKTSTGTIAHELGHALGLWHEHTFDAPELVKIDMTLLKQDGRNISQYEKTWVDIFSTDIPPYNPCSIMHYPGGGQSNNLYIKLTSKGRKVLQACLKSPEFVNVKSKRMGQREVVSKDDIEAIKTIYMNQPN